MDEKIKEKVREIQDKYCGLSVEYKIYKAIEETIKDEIKFLKYIIEYPELCKEKCKKRIAELKNSGYD